MGTLFLNFLQSIDYARNIDHSSQSILFVHSQYHQHEWDQELSQPKHEVFWLGYQMVFL